MKLDHSRLDVRRAEGSFWLWALLTFLWIAANSSFDPESVVFGALMAGALSFIFAKKTNVWSGLRFSPSRLLSFGLYTCTFAFELVRANLNMMRYVYSPRLDIAPGIVTISTRLKSPIGRLALANSIALTPGSLVLDVKDDKLLVHWLNVETTDPDEATRIIAGPFESHLEKVFG